MTYHFTTTLLALSAASLSLTACGSRHYNHAQSSGACGAYGPSCSASRYGHSDYSGAGYNGAAYNGGAYEAMQYNSVYDSPAYATPSPAPYIQAYPNLQPTYVPSQQSVVSYVQTPAPITEPVPTPVYEPAPIVEYTPEPIYESAPPLTSWAPETWANPSWTTDVDCPEGTIQGYGGEGCIQVAITRK